MAINYSVMPVKGAAGASFVHPFEELGVDIEFCEPIGVRNCVLTSNLQISWMWCAKATDFSTLESETTL